MNSRIGTLAMVIGILVSTAGAATTFKEANGIVSMEAEHTTTGAWTLIKGTSGSAFEDPGSGNLTYDITFTGTGKYYVYMLAGTNICGGDKANDCWITLDGQKLYAADNVTRPDGIRVGNSCCVATSMCWTQLPRGPGSHTPDNIKYLPVYAQVNSPRKKVFKVIHYAKGFRLDKIVLRQGVSSKMSGLGPAETIDTRTETTSTARLYTGVAGSTARGTPGDRILNLDGRMTHKKSAHCFTLPSKAFSPR